jgi:hypothetical protein
LPAYPGAADSPEPAWADAKIRRSDHGETLAVMALLLPVLAIAVTFAWHFNSLGIELAIGWGTVAVTALLVAIDAAFLGRVDLGGTERAGPIALFFGMCFLWILGYPVAFFRDIHWDIQDCSTGPTHDCRTVADARPVSTGRRHRHKNEGRRLLRRGVGRSGLS